jgi:hypothetical protein
MVMLRGFAVMNRNSNLTLQGNAISDGSIMTVRTSPSPVDKMFIITSIMARDLDNIVATRVEIGVSDGSSLLPINIVPGPFLPSQAMVIYWPCVLQ